MTFSLKAHFLLLNASDAFEQDLRRKSKPVGNTPSYRPIIGGLKGGSAIGGDANTLIINANLEKNGAAYVTRTRDPVITNDVLYQLS